MTTVRSKNTCGADGSSVAEAPRAPLLAAQYVRMSTDQQQYSLDNQALAIREYAEQHNMVIVRTYSDAGKTGLTLTERPGLRQLIDDVERRSPGYSIVLVYDISRWGRFQDADESAYYEYRCRRADIAVHYCAEQFPNDGSPVAALLKALKRAMAAEYSRELSVKVFAGQARLTELGFRQGGQAGYGFRRLLVDQQGTPKLVLRFREEKSIATDRVVLIPGPHHEIDVVREIFMLYASKRHSPADVASLLNERGEPWVGDRPWTRFAVREMVTNPKYIGSNVSNRRSGKLRSRRVVNPPEMWIRRDNAFAGIVEPELYQRAEAVAAKRAQQCTDAQLLQLLGDFLSRKGKITAKAISSDLDMPCPQAYTTRFGGLVEAYRTIGYQPDRGTLSFAESFKKLTPTRRRFTATVIEQFRKMGVEVTQDSRTGGALWAH
jgi:DNA invertase Pin-like site-specific DNA recombinase